VTERSSALVLAAQISERQHFDERNMGCRMSPFTFSILRLGIMAVILLLLSIVFVVAKTEAFIGGFALRGVREP
jgi:hypothetical protein